VFKPTTIRTRLLVCFVLVAVLPVIAVSVGSLAVAYGTGRRQVGGRLESVAALKQSAIEGWVRSLEEDLVVASNTDCAFERITVLLTMANDHKHYAFYNGAVRKRLQGLVGQSPHVEALFLVDLEGRVALSTLEGEEGQDMSQEPFFHQGLAAPYVQLPFPGDRDSPGASQLVSGESVVVAIPVVGQQGRPLGVIAARAHAEPLKDILAERTGLGDTGKAYLVDVDHAVLAGASLPLVAGLPPAAEGRPAAPDGPVASPVRIDAPGIRESLEGQRSTSGLYRDYRGALVLGTYRWLPRWDVVLSTEQDLSEGLRAVRGIFTINLAIGLAAVALAVISALFVTRTIADPLAGLAETATDIAAGNLDGRASTARQDEIGTLARAFNSMTAQLQDSITNLEERVEERTRALQKANETLERRAVQLETSARVSRELTSILDIDDLLTQVVELIRDAFHYYHVHIFLLDLDGQRLVLRASTSPTVPEHHCIAVDDSSINGKAIRRGEAVLVNDVKSDANYLADQYLPDTQSELVAPLRLGDRPIGTLDVQSTELNAFAAPDLLVIQSLGDQIAVAIENARLYDRSQELAVFEERNRLARELHDSVTQSMYSVVLLTEGWRRSIRNGGEAHVDEYLARIGEINQQGLKEMRLLIHELRPPVLEEDGLLGALHQRLDAVERRAGINARLLVDEIVELPHAVEEGLYRIAQEALNNSLKHADAADVVVRIGTADGKVVLEVEDDGQGFDLDAVGSNHGMGLANMRDRAAELGGSMDIRSAPGQGTRVKVEVAAGVSG
jgi:nitrate/nitrite-specific signal transduction histidine kinase